MGVKDNFKCNAPINVYTVICIIWVHALSHNMPRAYTATAHCGLINNLLAPPTLMESALNSTCPFLAKWLLLP